MTLRLDPNARAHRAERAKVVMAAMATGSTRLPDSCREQAAKCSTGQTCREHLTDARDKNGSAAAKRPGTALNLTA